MTDAVELTQEILHRAYAAAAQAMSIRPEPVINRSRDHVSARARSIVWWVLNRAELIPCDIIAELAGYSSSNIRHSAAAMSYALSVHDERKKDRAITAIYKALYPDQP